jgi:hypothetical protein
MRGKGIPHEFTSKASALITQLLGLGDGCIGLIATIECLKYNAFYVPGLCILWI